MLLYKKAQNWYLIMLLFSLATLLVLMSVYFSLFSDSVDNFVTTECSLFFNEGISTGAFYNSDLKGFNTRFFTFAEEKCNSFEVDLNKVGIDKGVELVDQCFSMTGGGTNLLPKEMYGEGVCFYCGSMKIENQDLTIFKDKISDTLEVDIELEGSNMMSDDLGLFFYQYRESLSGLDTVGQFIDSTLAYYLGFVGKQIDLFNPELEIRTGFAFANIVDTENGKRLYVDNQPYDEVLNCKTIVPQNIVS